MTAMVVLLNVEALETSAQRFADELKAREEAYVKERDAAAAAKPVSSPMDERDARLPGDPLSFPAVLHASRVRARIASSRPSRVSSVSVR